MTKDIDDRAREIAAHEAGLRDMLLRDNERMRKAGGALAEAAIYTVTEYDGLHRLSIAAADWCKAIADEGGRPHAVRAIITGENP